MLAHDRVLYGMSLLGHNGGDLDVAAEMFFWPGDGTGVILLMNGDWSTFINNLTQNLQ